MDSDTRKLELGYVKLGARLEGLEQKLDAHASTLREVRDYLAKVDEHLARLAIDVGVLKAVREVSRRDSLKWGGGIAAGVVAIFEALHQVLT